MIIIIVIIIICNPYIHMQYTIYIYIYIIFTHVNSTMDSLGHPGAPEGGSGAGTGSSAPMSMEMRSVFFSYQNRKCTKVSMIIHHYS